MSVSVTLLASSGTSALAADRGLGGETTGTRFGAALALAELDLPTLEFALRDDTAGAPVAEDESTDAPTPAAPIDTAPPGPPDIAAPVPQASAPLVIAPATVPAVPATSSASSADEAAASADPNDSEAALRAAAAVVAPTRDAETAEIASVAADGAPSAGGAAPARLAAAAAVGSAAPAASAARATPAAPEAFQPTAPEPPATPPDLPAVPPTLAPRETADAGATAPAYRAVHVAAVAPPPAPASVPAAPVEASGSSAAAPRAVAAQVSPAVVAIAQRPAGTHQLTMTVHPESLGPVTVRARIGADGDVRVELVGATDAGRDALRAIVSDLRRDLAAVMPHASLSLASTAGEAHDRGAQPGAGDRPDDQPRGESPTRGTGDTHPHAVSAADPTVPTTARAASGAGLDIFV